MTTSEAVERPGAACKRRREGPSRQALGRVAAVLNACTGAAEQAGRRRGPRDTASSAHASTIMQAAAWAPLRFPAAHNNSSIQPCLSGNAQRPAAGLGSPAHLAFLLLQRLAAATPTSEHTRADP